MRAVRRRWRHRRRRRQNSGGSPTGPTERCTVRRRNRLLLLLPIPVEQQQSQTVLLHGRLVRRRRRPVLELGVHHGGVRVVRPAVSGRYARQESSAVRLGAQPASTYFKQSVFACLYALYCLFLPHSALSSMGVPAGPARDEPPSPSIARQEGASCDVSRQAMPLTVISTMPTPESTKKARLM